MTTIGAKLKWWEQDPPKFTCLPDCGKCCTFPGDLNFGQEDITRIAKHFGITEKHFKRKYLTFSPTLGWQENSRNGCVFLDGTKCSIHEVKPIQCSAAPFWSDVMDSRENFDEFAEICPGMGEGDPVPVEVIREGIKASREVQDGGAGSKRL